MGVNGQKRKKKQGSVPTLEESVQKKLKRSKTTTAKFSEKGPETITAAPKPLLEQYQELGGDDNVEDRQVFGKTKALLFDDNEDKEDALRLDEFEGLDGDVDM